MADFGKWLKCWRAKFGLVQKQAASVLGVSLRTYQNWEMGRCDPQELARIELERRANEYAKTGNQN